MKSTLIVPTLSQSPLCNHFKKKFSVSLNFFQNVLNVFDIKTIYLLIQFDDSKLCFVHIIRLTDKSRKSNFNFPYKSETFGSLFSILVLITIQGWDLTAIYQPMCNIFAEQGYSLPIEYYDSIKGWLSDSYLVIGHVWILFIKYMLLSQNKSMWLLIGPKKIKCFSMRMERTWCNTNPQKDLLRRFIYHTLWVKTYTYELLFRSALKM